MIKSLKKYEIHTTPFEATKNWAINNTDNENLLLYEHSGSTDDGLPYALEFIDYGLGIHYPVTNSACNISLEQQDADLASLEVGLKVIGIFYPGQDPTNLDGTYMRSIFSQVKTMFYNTYYDPTKIWGIENIDFPLSKTERRLSDRVRLIDIPRLVFGDKIVPKTVVMIDTTTDNEYLITDDGYGNLKAGINLFSRQQEIRKHTNTYQLGYSSECDNYFDFEPPPNLPIVLTGNQVDHLEQVELDWTYAGACFGFVIERSLDSGSTFAQIQTVPQVFQTFDNDVVYGGRYWYRVAPFNGFGLGPYSNTVEVPVIGLFWVSQPQDIFSDISTSVSFSVIADGIEPISYQWQTGSISVLDTDRITGSFLSSGSTSSSLFINTLHLEDSGSYKVIAFNAVTSITSSYAQLHVNLYPPVILKNPVDQYTVPTFTASFTVSASGDNYGYTPLSYQWISGSTLLFDTGRITGSNSQSLGILNVLESDSGSYYAHVCNRIACVDSNIAWLYILPNIISKSLSDSSASMNLSLLFGSTANVANIDPGGTFSLAHQSGSLTNVILSVSASDSGSTDLGLFSGSVINVILGLSGNHDTASVDTAFYSGSIVTLILSIGEQHDSSSVDTAFYSGSLATFAINVPEIDYATMSLQLYSGNIDNWTASFSGSPLAGTAPLAVTFSNDSNTVFSAYSWSFGDGTNSSLKYASHSYVSPGSYNVTMSAYTTTSYTSSMSRSSYVVVS